MSERKLSAVATRALEMLREAFPAELTVNEIRDRMEGNPFSQPRTYLPKYQTVSVALRSLALSGRVVVRQESVAAGQGAPCRRNVYRYRGLAMSTDEEREALRAYAAEYVAEGDRGEWLRAQEMKAWKTALALLYEHATLKARAAELETLVHSEVATLERAYGENEIRIRALVDELITQREAILANAERVRHRRADDAAHGGGLANRSPCVRTQRKRRHPG